ncbi:MAG: curli-like amyloid fiber formation chaperone CsgH [Bacteroidota bacterium]
MGLWLLAVLAAFAPEAASGDARLVVERSPGEVRVTGVYDGPARDGLTYRLTVEKEGASGRSRSAQSGAVRGDTLSTSAVAVAPGDRLVVELRIEEGARLVAADALDTRIER